MRQSHGMRSGIWIWSLALALLVQGPVEAQSSAKGKSDRGKNADPQVPVAIGGGSGLIVSGIEVKAAGKTPADARQNGWREAQRLAWPALWTRMSGQPASSAPKLSDSALDSIVSAIEVEREQIGPTVYIARLAVVFDRARASSHLGRYGQLVTSPPLLLLPVLQDAGTRMSHESDSLWLKAWARLRAGETAIDYVRIQPTPGDVILLNAWQAERRHLFLWRHLIDRYQVADVLIPELILERSVVRGPLSAMLIVRFGPSGRELGRMRLTNDAGDLDSLLDRAVRESDRIYVATLRAGNLLPDPSLLEPDEPLPDLVEDELSGAYDGLGIRLRVATPDDATLAAIERDLRMTPGVAGVRLQSFVLGGESVVEVSTLLPLDQLRLALDSRGLRLDNGLLRRRAPNEAPLAPPPPPPVANGPEQLLPPMP